MSRSSRSILPGFGLSLGLTATWLGLLVLVPVIALVLKSATLSGAQWWQTVTSERVLTALQLSFGAALLAAVIDAVVGLLIAWVLCRYQFPGRSLWDALVDLPFALPTAVAGIALTALYTPAGWLGKPLHALGIQVAFAKPGVVLALVFIGLPFVVRTLQPVLLGLEKELEEAAESLGATPTQVFMRVLLPALRPALLTGFALAFARAVGEYGSVVFISGNLPGRTEIAPLLIVSRLEAYDYAGATALAVVMLVVAVMTLLALHALHAWQGRSREARVAS